MDDEKTNNKTRQPTDSKKLVFDVLRFIGKITAAIVKPFASIIAFFVIFLVLGEFLSGPLGQSQSREVVVSGSGESKIVVVPIHGIILNEVDPFANSGTVTPEAVAKILRSIARDEQAKAVIFDLDSPGGSAVASDRIFGEIQSFKKDTKKPVVTLMGDTVASGGYFISSATDRIVANPATITGSIGVIATNFKIQELLEKIGVKEEVFKKGEYKDIFSNVRDTTPEEKEIIDGILDDAYNLFVSRIVEGRRMPVETVKKLATGRIYSGREAQAVGLVDSLGNLDEAVSEAKKLAKIEDVKVVRIESSSLFHQLFSGLSLRAIFPYLRTPSGTKVWYLMQ